MPDFETHEHLNCYTERSCPGNACYLRGPTHVSVEACSELCKSEAHCMAFITETPRRGKLPLCYLRTAVANLSQCSPGIRHNTHILESAPAVNFAVTRTTMRWLLAISMPCPSTERQEWHSRERAFTEADISNYGGPSFHVFVNIYNSNHSCLSPRYASLPHVHVSFVNGYMTHFWKHVLTPAVTRAFDVIALKDADILLSPHTLQVSEVQYWMRQTQAA